MDNKTVVVLWSGGKDSTASILLYLKAGYKVIAICYIPFFDKDKPLIDSAVYDFIFNSKAYFESLGVTVFIVNGISYVDWCKVVLGERSKRSGDFRGYPCFMRGKCGFARDSKIKSVGLVKKQFDGLPIDIGFTIDEIAYRKTLSYNERSILLENNFTQGDSFNLCRTHSLLSPVYSYKMRDGCLLCPHAKSIERYRFFECYNAKTALLDLQYDLKNRSLSLGYDLFYPLRGKHFFIENADFISPNSSKISIFGDTIL